MQNLIALDWGTSSFRAYLLDNQGAIVNKIDSSAGGILNVAEQTFKEILINQLHALGQDWSSTPPIIATGMITSRQGWVETPYIECPADVQHIADNLTSLYDDQVGKIWFTPGVKQLHPEPDIMRGEETQIVGLQASEQQTVLLPGTHSKWVRLDKGAITSFTTFMTGDIFNAVKKHTILRSVTDTSWSDDAFKEGVLTGIAQTEKGQSLLAGLFQTRVKSILGLSSLAGSESYLSGLLIGCEIAQAKTLFLTQEDSVTLLGSSYLTQLYQTALTLSGIASTTGPEDVSAHGLYTIAKMANIIS